MEPSNRTILQDKVPRFIRLSIDQIRVPNCNFEWIDNGNFYLMSVPAVKEPALPQAGNGRPCGRLKSKSKTAAILTYRSGITKCNNCRLKAGGLRIPKGDSKTAHDG